MAKKKGFTPFIYFDGNTETPGDDIAIGGHTGQGGVTVNAFPMSFDQWMDSEWKDDYIIDGDINMYDYASWWDYCGFSKEDWERFNGDTWDQYFG